MKATETDWIYLKQMAGRDAANIKKAIADVMEDLADLRAKLGIPRVTAVAEEEAPKPDAVTADEAK
jgi:hypothetical protein